MRGASWIVLACSAVCLGSESDWTRVSDGKFEVYSQTGEAAGRAALRWFEQLRALVRRETGFDPESSHPIRVIGFRSEREYEAFRRSPTSDAYYVGAAGRDYIAMPSLGRNSYATAAHEYAHLIQHSVGARLPPWLREGLADLLATVKMGPDGTHAGGDLPARSGILRRRPWMPLPQLLSMPADSPLRGYRTASELFYAQSWALTSMLALSPEYAPQFESLVKALRRGEDSARALEAEYGRPLSRIQHDLSRWVDHPPKALLLEDVEPAPAQVTVAPQSEDSVQRMMAAVMISVGDFDRAEAVFRTQLQTNPRSGEALAGLGTVAAGRKRYDEAAGLWKQALEAGMQDAGLCFQYAELLDRDGVNEQELRVALREAIALVPDFDEARWRLATLEKNTGHYESAVEQLEKIKQVPAARSHAYWSAMADALTSLSREEDARAAAKRAGDAAASDAERARAERLDYMARTRLEVRMERDAAGEMRLVTTRVPKRAAFNPFIEPADDMRQARGRLREVECGDAGLRILLETAEGELRLSIPDPARVRMVNAPPELVCGKQEGNAVLVEYAAAKDRAGLVRGLEFP